MLWGLGGVNVEGSQSGLGLGLGGFWRLMAEEQHQFWLNPPYGLVRFGGFGGGCWLCTVVIWLNPPYGFVAVGCLFEDPILDLFEAFPIGLAFEAVGDAFFDFGFQLLGDGDKLLGGFDVVADAFLAALDHGHGEVDSRLGILGVELDGAASGFEGELGLAVDEVQPGKTGPGGAALGGAIAQAFEHWDEVPHGFTVAITLNAAAE